MLYKYSEMNLSWNQGSDISKVIVNSWDFFIGYKIEGDKEEKLSELWSRRSFFLTIFWKKNSLLTRSLNIYVNF